MFSDAQCLHIVEEMRLWEQEEREQQKENLQETARAFLLSADQLV